MLVSVAIPVFRNAESLIELHERIIAAVAAIPDRDIRNRLYR